MFTLKSILAPARRPAARFGQRRQISRNMPVEYFILANTRFEGPIVGEFAGQPIRERAVDANGLHYRYCGLASRDCNGRFDVESLEAGEWIVRPGLLYAIDTDGAPDLQG